MQQLLYPIIFVICGLYFDDIWFVLEKEYESKDGDYEAYQAAFKEIKTLEPNSCESAVTLIVAKVENHLEAGNYIFDVFGIKDGDESHYALEMTSWNEWLNFLVLDKSLKLYGAADVAAHVLYEMTFFGYSSGIVDEEVKNEKIILEERHKEHKMVALS